MQRYFYYCTDKVMEAVNIGSMEMLTMKQNELSPEFILLGLLQQDDSMLMNIFKDMSLDGEDIKQKLSFDIVLALNIFHHFIKNDRLPQLASCLGRIDCREMYYQGHSDEPQMQGHITSDEMVGWVIRNSCLQYSRVIGISGDRKIYKLWRD